MSRLTRIWAHGDRGRDTGLAGRCAIVAGAARGQGEAHARALAAAGARVVITGLSGYATGSELLVDGGWTTG